MAAARQRTRTGRDAGGDTEAVEHEAPSPRLAPPPHGVIHPRRCVHAGLRAQTSTVGEAAGVGLFTTTPLERHTCLGIYTGRHCPSTASSAATHRHQVAGGPSGQVIVQADTRIDLLAFANEPPEGAAANLWLEYGRISLEGYEIYVPVFITSHRIAAGAELLLHYGKAYEALRIPSLKRSAL